MNLLPVNAKNPVQGYPNENMVEIKTEDKRAVVGAINVYDMPPCVVENLPDSLRSVIYPLKRRIRMVGNKEASRYGALVTTLYDGDVIDACIYDFGIFDTLSNQGMYFGTPDVVFSRNENNKMTVDNTEKWTPAYREIMTAAREEARRVKDGREHPWKGVFKHQNR